MERLIPLAVQLNVFCRERQYAAGRTSRRSGNFGLNKEREYEEQWYTPYFSMWNWRGTGEAGNVENSYHYRYYEMDEMKIDWDAVAIGFETNRDWYYEVQGGLPPGNHAAYTAVPEETLPRLTRFCAENPVESPEQATL